MSGTKTLTEKQQRLVAHGEGKDYFLDGSALGSGKTFMALESLRLRFYEQFPRVLVVTLNSAKDVWRSEIEDVLDWPVVVLPSGATAEQRRAAFESFEWGFFVVHWEMVGIAWLDDEGNRVSDAARRKAKQQGRPIKVKATPLMPQLSRFEWDAVIADEAHRGIKNRKSLRTRGFKKIKTGYRRAVTGTSIVNTPDEAWSLLNWLDPKRYSSYWRFFNQHVLWTEDEYGYRHIVGVRDPEAFRAEIDDFYGALDAPPLPLTYQTITLSMEGEQKRAYRQMAKDSETMIDDEPGEYLPAPTVLSQLTRLRQFACAYARFDARGNVMLSEPSNKLDALSDIIDSTDQPLVVFTQFKQMLRLIEARLEARGVEFFSMDGDTPTDERTKMIEAFQSGERQVFAATMQTGGTGVTLTRAHTMVFTDRSWSPAENDQAEGRCFGRANDPHGLHVIILQSRSSVDQQVEEKVVLKKSWLKQMFRRWEEE